MKKTSLLRDLSWLAHPHTSTTSEQFRGFLEEADALWMHSGNSSDPHAELTSGKCSNGFVDVLRALRFSDFCLRMAHELAFKIREEYKGPIDWVVGSDHAGAVFSQNVAICLQAQHDFTEKGEGKSQNWRRFKIQPGEVVLQVEELMTTALTFQEVRRGIIRGNDGIPVTFAPVAGVLVHRSDVYEVEDTKMVFFDHYDITVWEPGAATCPLCAAGSRRIKAKTNWAELTGKI
jgi:orotate phosphoribosyltransferase